MIAWASSLILVGMPVPQLKALPIAALFSSMSITMSTTSWTDTKSLVALPSP